MRVGGRPGRHLLLLLIFAASGTGAVAGQGLLEIRPGGQLGFDFHGQWQGGGPAEELDGRYRQWLTLPFAGALIHPDILNYRLTLRPALSQHAAPGVGPTLTSRELGLAFDGRVLERNKLSLTVGLDRSAGSNGNGLASGFFTGSTRTLTLQYRDAYFPALLSHSSRDWRSSWRASGEAPPFDQDYVNSVTRFQLDNRKLTIQWQRLAQDDRLRDEQFVNTDAVARHRVGWGRGSSLVSRFEWSSRAGLSDTRRRSWQEHVHLQHAATTSTDIEFEQTTSETVAARTATRSLTLDTRSRATAWLTAGGRVGFRSARFGDMSDDMVGFGPSLRAVAQLPAGIRATAGARLSYDRRLRSFDEPRVVERLDEPHEFGTARSFTIEEEGVVPESIVLYSEDRTVRYLEGADYNVVLAPGWVEVVALAGGRIEGGDHVLVSYQVRIATVPPTEALTGSFDLALHRAGVSLRHANAVRTETEEADRIGLPTGRYREARTGLAASLGSPLGQWRMEAERRARRSSTRDYETWQLGLDLVLPQTRRAQVSLGASARITDGDAGTLSGRSLHVALRWLPTSRLNIDSSLQAWSWDLGDLRHQRSVSANTNVGFSFGAIRARLHYQWDMRDLLRSESGSRLSFRLVRSFY